MNCHDAEPFLLDASAALDPEVQEHLATCAACRSTQAAFAESRALLRAELPVTPPPEVRTAFYSALRALPSPALRASWMRRWSLPGWMRPLRLAFAFVAVFALGALTMRTWLSEPAPPAEVRRVLEHLSDPSPALRLTGIHRAATDGMVERSVREALLAVIASDPSVNVRVAALEALEAHAHDASVRAAVVRVLGTDPAPLVQLAALRFIETHRSADVRPALEALLQQPDLEPLVRDQVRTFLTTSI